ncbi:VOC family protein [Bremerella cremea]|uniref:Glyoxalase n=1 Tax=Blastopirellula marina TaxID=124 RepID=A0A2S8FBN6_9BACT|nr:MULTISPECIES: VOC family protein [Pirellulaceae]PQO29549.1 glyoxalase [Blastopirellula marina]RCS42853.1 VOC family protein [Bremerella cremea]
MEPRISLITLGVSDLAKALAFYRDGLGIPTTWTGERGVVFFKTTGTCLALYPFDKLAEDVGEAWVGEQKSKFPGIALAHNVRKKEDVDRILSQAEAAGGKIEKPGQDTFWGGYSGYFSDLDGYLWEVAYGAFEFNEDGSLIIP